MPIEIRELVVRARIEPGAERGPQDARWRDSAPRDGAPEQETVHACVREALRALADRNER